MSNSEQSTAAQSEASHDRRSHLSTGVILWLMISWIWVGVPLSWGVYQTVLKSLPLFHQAAHDAPK